MGNLDVNNAINIFGGVATSIWGKPSNTVPVYIPQYGGSSTSEGYTVDLNRGLIGGMSPTLLIIVAVGALLLFKK